METNLAVEGFGGYVSLLPAMIVLPKKEKNSFDERMQFKACFFSTDFR